MAQTLNDSIIREKLINNVILADDYASNKNLAHAHINPNGIELRLGNEVRFLNSPTHDHKIILNEGQFLILKPGDSVLVSSYEKVDFSREICQKLFGEKCLMALIHPTTTMMREGVSQIATKIDSGFKGCLNWMIRNNSGHDIIIKCKEPLYKLTILLLDENEKPDIFYGESEKHQFQDSKGVVASTRSIPAHIPKELRVELPNNSGGYNREKLSEQGFPFNHVAQEFQRIDGEFEAVRKRIDSLQEQIKETKNALSEKIDNETNSIAYKIKDAEHSFGNNLDKKLKDSEKNIFDQVQLLISNNTFKTILLLLSGISAIAALAELLSIFLKDTPEWTLPTIGIVLSLLAIVLWGIFQKRR